MTDPNAQQIEHWNGVVGERWAVRQANFDRLLEEITQALLPVAKVSAGERVLDVGCGAGTTSFRLEELVGETGAVLGADVSAPMLGVARARAIATGSKVSFIQADASLHPFDPTFDLCFSRFGVMFFSDPVLAFTNLRRALKPSGRLAFVCWRPFAENDWGHVPYQAARHLIPAEPPQDPDAPGPFAFGDPARVQRILAASGFVGARIDRLDTRAEMGIDLDSAADEALQIGPLARATREMPEAQRAEIKAVARESLVPYLGPNGVTVPAACWLVTAEAG